MDTQETIQRFGAIVIDPTQVRAIAPTGDTTTILFNDGATLSVDDANYPSVSALMNAIAPKVASQSPSAS